MTVHRTETMQENGRIYSRPESRNLWICFRTPDGRLVRKSAETTNKSEAQKRLQREIALAKSITFKEAVVDFFEVKDREGGLRASTISNYKSNLRAVNDTLGGLTLEGITQDVLKGYIRHRRKSVSDVAVKRDLAFVSSVFTHAIDTMPNAPTVNPVRQMSKRGLKEVQRTRWLRPKEFTALTKACTNTIQQDVLFTAVHTGMRHSELTALRKHMIDFERKEIHLEAELVKSKRDRVIPLCDDLCVRLKGLCKEAPRDLVFYYIDSRTREAAPYGNFNNFWRGVRARAKIKDIRFHDLRHTFASWWVQAGGDPLRLRDILGHSSIAMVERYGHLNTAAYHEEIRKVFKTQFTHRTE